MEGAGVSLFNLPGCAGVPLFNQVRSGGVGAVFLVPGAGIFTFTP